MAEQVQQKTQLTIRRKTISVCLREFTSVVDGIAAIAIDEQSDSGVAEDLKLQTQFLLLHDVHFG